ncbi:KIP2 [Acrasis kona]|uniref:KIP2 n=1 Tax=Acrasis kona TaxID=1008807 RepID=A0AAW2YJ71_9EUKA
MEDDHEEWEDHVVDKSYIIDIQKQEIKHLETVLMMVDCTCTKLSNKVAAHDEHYCIFDGTLTRSTLTAATYNLSRDYLLMIMSDLEGTIKELDATISQLSKSTQRQHPLVNKAEHDDIMTSQERAVNIVQKRKKGRAWNYQLNNDIKRVQRTLTIDNSDIVFKISPTSPQDPIKQPQPKKSFLNNISKFLHPYRIHDDSMTTIATLDTKKKNATNNKTTLLSKIKSIKY